MSKVINITDTRGFAGDKGHSIEIIWLKKEQISEIREIVEKALKEAGYELHSVPLV